MAANQKLNLVVKIGTAALSRADGTPDPLLLGNIVGELTTLKRKGHNVVLVSSGAMGTGRAMLKNKRALRNCDHATERQILASLGQAKLMTLYQELLAPLGFLAAQILLTKQDFRTRDHHKHVAHLFAALQQQPHILPIVNENDSVTLDELMFTDNDELAGLLAAMFNADRLIILTSIAGVYDRSPDINAAQIISHIDWSKKEGIPSDTKGKSTGGRGGMTSKLNIARKMAALGIRTHIAAARELNIITRLLDNEEVGTTVAAVPGKRNAVKRWLASEVNAVPASVSANACLAEMIRNPTQTLSLLPVGLTDISGTFDKGDLVQVTDDKGKVLALGVARYDAAALRKALGKKQQPVFIHYDQLHRIDND